MSTDTYCAIKCFPCVRKTLKFSTVVNDLSVRLKFHNNSLLYPVEVLSKFQISPSKNRN